MKLDNDYPLLLSMESTQTIEFALPLHVFESLKLQYHFQLDFLIYPHILIYHKKFHAI